MRTTNNRRQSVSINAKKLTSYAVAGAAAACVGTPDAEAGIIYVQVNATMNDTTGAGVARNLSFSPTGGGSNWSLTMNHARDTDPANGFAFIGNLANPANAAQFAGFVVGQYSYVSKIAANSLINTQTFLAADAIGALASNAPNGGSQFQVAEPGFIGVKFNTNQFGWIRVNMNGSPLNSFTIVDYAYADAGESIRAGQITAVPEPTSLCLLAAGSVGIAAWRRRRVAVAAATSAA